MFHQISQVFNLPLKAHTDILENSFIGFYQEFKLADRCKFHLYAPNMEIRLGWIFHRLSLRLETEGTASLAEK